MNNETVFLSKEFDKKVKECRLHEMENPSNVTVLEEVLCATNVTEVDASCEQLMELLQNFHGTVSSMLRGKNAYNFARESLKSCMGKKKRRLL